MNIIYKAAVFFLHIFTRMGGKAGQAAKLRQQSGRDNTAANQAANIRLVFDKVTACDLQYIL
ncbi:MAG: hypothetical protein PUA72_11460 [Lachnospiraceae bacterium]|nr:hypothetical protein [Lachnospiraceae bacterium]